MLSGKLNPLSQMETTCGSLLHELQIIWDEVGESDSEKDRMLLELEKECMEVYRRKVDLANRNRAQLRQDIAEAEAELAVICSSMGELPVHIRQNEKSDGSLNAELRAILPQIEEMRKRKSDRRNQFIKVVEDIQRIKNEMYRTGAYASGNMIVDETDLSLRKLEELNRELQALEKEKSARLKKVMEHLTYTCSYCSVLGLDFKQTVSEIHPSLEESESSKNISNDTIEKLASTIVRLREVKIQRMQQLQDLATSLLELWNLMDTPVEEQQMFQKVTCNIAASEDEITEPDMLSTDYISKVKAEVSRLEELNVTKMKELVFKKKAELEDLCRKTHLVPESDGSVNIALEAVESAKGVGHASVALEQFELRISEVKEESLRRKEILEKVEKWMAACEEESWLEEYNRDDNRYNAGRGAHLTLKRAEKARILVNKLPAMVDALASKTAAWENENGIYFTYDGVRLLSMLESYKVLRQEKELEQKRQREQKKLQGQLLTEQEALYGSKPSPMKNQSAKKGPRLSCGGGASNRRLSLGGLSHQTPKATMPPSAKATPNMQDAKRMERINHDGNEDDGFTALSCGRRGLDLAGVPVKPHSLNLHIAREIESPVRRTPFSPISSTDSSKFNVANLMEDLSKKQNDIFQKILTNNNVTPFSTPSKHISVAELENRTPFSEGTPRNRSSGDGVGPVAQRIRARGYEPVPSTPSSTLTIPMQTTTTPLQPAGKFISEEIEYSFEERRAGFVLPRLHGVNLMQV